MDGIECEHTSATSSRIIETGLYSNHLNGTIPYSIGNLEMLGKLLVYNNNLSSTIPNSIGYLIELTQLYLFQTN